MLVKPCSSSSNWLLYWLLLFLLYDVWKQPVPRSTPSSLGFSWIHCLGQKKSFWLNFQTCVLGAGLLTESIYLALKNKAYKSKARFFQQQYYLSSVETGGFIFHQTELGQLECISQFLLMNSTIREVTSKPDCWIFFLFNLNLPFYSQLIFLLPLPVLFSFTFGLSFGEFSLLMEW